MKIAQARSLEIGVKVNYVTRKGELVDTGEVVVVGPKIGIYWPGIKMLRMYKHKDLRGNFTLE
jgi:hypothetical protein